MATRTSDGNLRETIIKGLELGAKRKELAAEVNRVKADIVRQTGSATESSGEESVRLHEMLSGFLAACW